MVIGSSCTHGHSDTCKRHNCAGVDGDCGMVYPRVKRRRLRWVGDSGSFALPRTGPNLVSQQPAVSMAFGCNNNFTLACEVDRAYTAQVATELDKPLEERNTEVLADILAPAADRGRLAGYYSCKYTGKAMPLSQSAKLLRALSVSAQFLHEPAAFTSPATDAAALQRQGFGNVVAAVNRLTSCLTVGLALAAFKLAGHNTLETSYDVAMLPVGPFVAVALSAAGAAGDMGSMGATPEDAAETLLVPDDAGGLSTCTALNHYMQRGAELDGPECSPYMLAMAYQVDKLPEGRHPHLAAAGAAPQRATPQVRSGVPTLVVV